MIDLLLLLLSLLHTLLLSLIEVEGTPGPSTVVSAPVTVSKFYMKGQLRCEH
jgi:hypothetical protein